jgi:FkbM family methyltransferase
MVELGSYWAYYSLWFQKAVRRATTYLIEPDPNNLAVGRRNFALNGMTGHFIHGAVGRSPRPPAPFLCESDRAQRLVPTLCIDELVRQQAIRSVDVLFADIQGAELEMLEGAAASIGQGLIRFVVVSTHHHEISRDPLTHQNCLDFLRDRRAHILVEHSVAEAYSGDGLIVAALRPEDCRLPCIEISRNHPANSLFGELEQALAAARQGLLDELAKASDCVNRLNEALASSAEREAKVNGRLAEVNGQFVALRDHPVVRALRALRHPLRAARRLWPAA